MGRAGGGGENGRRRAWSLLLLLHSQPSPYGFIWCLLLGSFFLLLLYPHMRRCRKGSVFQSPFDNFRENRNRSFYNFPTTCRKRISIIRVRKVLFSPWSYHKFNIYYLSMYVFLYGNNFIPLSYKRKNRNLE